MAYTLHINGVEATNPIKTKITTSLDNWSGKFGIEFRDETGTFDINTGYEILVKDTGTTVFGGFVERFERKNRNIVASGLDYTSLLTKIYANESYSNKSPDYIVKDLIAKYASELTTTGVYASTKTITELRLKGIQLFKAFQELAKYDNCNFYVDKTKNSVFDKLGQTSSGITLEKGVNIMTDSYETIDDKLINRVQVTGGREDYTKTETEIAIAAQTEFFTDYKPVSIRITVDGTEKIGFKEGMKTLAEYDYTMDRENKKITFNVAPGVGKSVAMEYVYTSPVKILAEDGPSVATYGVYEKIITDETIVKKADAQSIAGQILAKYSQPIVTGKIMTRLNITANIGQTVIAINPTKNINGNFIIVGIERNFFVGGRTTTYNLASLSESVLELLAEIIQRIDALEETQRGDTDIFSYLRSFTDNATSNDDPANNLDIRKRTVNHTATWYFATPHLFSEPITFGGGSGPYGSNLVTNPSE